MLKTALPRLTGLNGLPAVIIAGLLAVLLSGCGGGGFMGSVLGGLKGRCAGYYNYMIGRFPKQAYSSYLSPAYKAKFSRDDLRKLDESRRKGSKPNTRYPLAKADDVLLTQQDRFAWSVVDPELGDAFAVLQAQRWVKVGASWYLYSGTQSEIDAYGVFPPELAPPPLIEFDKRRAEAAEKQKAKAAGKAKGKPQGEDAAPGDADQGDAGQGDADSSDAGSAGDSAGDGAAGGGN